MSSDGACAVGNLFRSGPIHAASEGSPRRDATSNITSLQSTLTLFEAAAVISTVSPIQRVHCIRNGSMLWQGPWRRQIEITRHCQLRIWVLNFVGLEKYYFMYLLFQHWSSISKADPHPLFLPRIDRPKPRERSRETSKSYSEGTTAQRWKNTPSESKHGRSQSQSTTTTTEPIPTHNTPKWRAYTFPLSDRCLVTTASHSTLFSPTTVAAAPGSIAAAPGSIAAIPGPIGLFLVSLPAFNRQVRVVESGSIRFSS